MAAEHRCRRGRVRAGAAWQPERASCGSLLVSFLQLGKDEVVVSGQIADHADIWPRGGPGRLRHPLAGQPVTSCWAVTFRPLIVTITPCRRPSVYALPGLMATVRPIFLAALDSWICPCRDRTGWTRSMSWRTDVLPTGASIGWAPGPSTFFSLVIAQCSSRPRP